MNTIRHTFDLALQGLRDDIQQMGARVQTTLLEAVRAFAERDLDAARIIIDADREINTLHHDLEQRCVQIIATQQPMAGDLRDIAAVMYLAGELERIADYAKTLAKLSLRIGDEAFAEPLVNIPRMAELSSDMLDRALIAYTTRNTDLAYAISADDEAVDALYDRVFRRAMAYVRDDPAHMDQMNYVVMAAYSLERTADRVVNMCERIVYMVDAKLVDLDQEVPLPVP